MEPTVPSRLFTWKHAILGGVGAFFVLIGVGVGWVMFGNGTGSTTAEASTSIEPSVAVMPCTDASAPGDQTPLTQGFAEGIIGGLAQLPGLKVIGITSVIALLELNADIEEIAETLDVATVLECDLQQVGETVRVRPRLVEAATGAVLWSEAIDGPASNVFAIQDALARAVTDELQVALAGGAETPLVAQGTTVPEAFQAYQRGRFFVSQRTVQRLRDAITEFELAIELDPEYAEAYSGLADSYLLVPSYDLTSTPQDQRMSVDQGLIAARRAVQLGPSLGMAHTSLGYGLWWGGEWERAEQEFELAIDLEPGYATAHQWYGAHFRSTGSAIEAVIHAERALELDPVARIISRNLGRSLWAAGRIDEAIEQHRETTALAPEWQGGWFDLSAALLEVGEYEEGQEAFGRYLEIANVDVQAARDAYEAAIRYHQTGHLQTFSDFEWGRRALIWLYTETGQSERLLPLLEEMVRAGNYGPAASLDARSPHSDLLRDDPRYQALLEEAGITW